jgi:hypothetical protein
MENPIAIKAVGEFAAGIKGGQIVYNGILYKYNKVTNHFVIQSQYDRYKDYMVGDLIDALD